MSDTVIKIENLGKKYTLTHKQPQKYIALRDVLVDRAKRLSEKIIRPLIGTGKAGKTSSPDLEEFWALSDVSFDVKQGERVGIIGRNGAGKSTLLKILSRITEPTTGRVSIKGRIASLLEVGTGFHPELTGRENIYLNGAILGMSKAEIRKNFDAIVDFAGVEQFLDTPVKHYSSGMYVRLAFAVAAHLDTEILLIDEVLAVGDAEFQKKCMGKMDEVSHKEGRTILFVSHNMPMVASLCESGVWLERGKILDHGVISSLIIKYSNTRKEGGGCFAEFSPGEYGNGIAELLSVSVENDMGQLSGEFAITEPICLKMKYRIKEKDISLSPNFHVYDSTGQCIFVMSDAGFDYAGTKKAVPGIYIASCNIPGNFLNDGAYSVGFALTTMSTVTIHFYAQNVLNFIIIDDMLNTPTRGLYRGAFPGAVRPLLNWNSEIIS
ncbi:MAG: ABC transporter ATP-binding protein [Synergistaceae bacterium]|jgi:lipopolysaccharide transport system ATP-binding protein|nr:ABC transporter ATP-binding protein [Synergistaceae bacterium]